MFLEIINWYKKQLNQNTGLVFWDYFGQKASFLIAVVSRGFISGNLSNQTNFQLLCLMGDGYFGFRAIFQIKCYLITVLNVSIGSQVLPTKFRPQSELINTQSFQLSLQECSCFGLIFKKKTPKQHPNIQKRQFWQNPYSKKHIGASSSTIISAVRSKDCCWHNRLQTFHFLIGSILRTMIVSIQKQKLQILIYNYFTMNCNYYWQPSCFQIMSDVPTNIYLDQTGLNLQNPTVSEPSYEQLKNKCEKLKLQNFTLREELARQRQHKFKKEKRIVKRRKQEELDKIFRCQHLKCKKQYASSLALNLDIKTKHVPQHHEKSSDKRNEVFFERNMIKQQEEISNIVESKQFFTDF